MADNGPKELSTKEKFRLRATVLFTFTPGTPVNNLDLLVGRETRDQQSP